MAIRLDGKVALVTAASEGLGFACARRLAEAGSAVAICARREEVLAKAQTALAKAGGGEVVAVPTDIADPAAVKRLVDEVVKAFGRIDVSSSTPAMSIMAGWKSWTTTSGGMPSTCSS